MKKLVIIGTILSLATAGLFAQNELDALRYSWQIPTGTARTVAMGGAFGALGGDLTSMSTNPAGIAVYRQSDFSITPSFEYINSNALFLNDKSDDFDYNFNVNNIGYVGTFNINGSNSGIKNINLGFGYTRLNNFHQNTLITGKNPYNSMTDWFAKRANGMHYSSLEFNDNFYSDLAWQTYLIDQVSATDTMNYVSVMNGQYGQDVSHSITTDGYQGEYNISLAANFEHLIYFGASLGIQPIRYEQTIFHTEEDTDDLINDFNSFDFKERLNTSGSGVNFKFGVLARPADWIRVGGAIHTPSFYNLSDEYSTDLSSNFVTPDYSRSWYSKQGNYNYQLTTPFRAMGNLAFVIEKYALISFDYEYTNYSAARLRAYDYTFVTENNTIKSEYSSAHNFKAGIEYRIGFISLRAGAAYYGSPYVSSHINSKAYQMMYSGGIGFRGQSFYLDIAYANVSSSDIYFMYDNGITSPASEITKSSNRIVTSLGFKF